MYIKEIFILLLQLFSLLIASIRKEKNFNKIKALIYCFKLIKIYN